LGAGNYFVRVSQYSGNTNYTLNLSATPGLGYAPELNNTLSTAYDIGTLNGDRSFVGYVGSDDTQDIYRFTLGTTSNFNLSLAGLSADADVYVIRDSNNNGILDPGETIALSANVGTLPESINLQGLGAGNYFVEVRQFNGNTNYTLNMTATPGLGQATESNNTLSTAYNVGTLTGDRSFVGYVGSDDTQDIYHFTLGTTSNFSLSLLGLSADADVYIFNSNRTVIGSSTNVGTTSESLSGTLAAGDYYIEVLQYSGNTNYLLNFSAV